MDFPQFRHIWKELFRGRLTELLSARRCQRRLAPVRMMR